MRLFPVASALVCFGGLTLSSHADHGRDFILLQDYHVPAPLDGSVFSGFEWSKRASDDELSMESGFMLGVAPRISLGASVHFGDEGQGWDYSSVMPMIHLQLTPPDSKWPIKVAFMAGYQFAQDDEGGSSDRYETYEVTTTERSKSGQVVTTTTSGGGTVTPPDGDGGTDSPDPCGPAYGPDAPPCEDDGIVLFHVGHEEHDGGTAVPGKIITKTTKGKDGATVTRVTKKRRLVKSSGGHSHNGIHRHGESGFHARLILEADLTESDKFLFNLIHLTPQEGKPAWGYATGLRHSFNHDWAVGVEATGDFGDANEHQIVLGGYFSPIHAATIKLGVGFGLTEESPDFSLRTGFVIRF